MADLGRVHVKDNEVKQAIINALEQIGGIDIFVQPGEKVLLKPNFNTADPYPASTDPEFLKAMVEIVNEVGASKVIIGESSTFSLNTESVMKKKAVSDLLNMNPAPEIISFDTGEWVKKDISGAKYQKHMSVPKILTEVDKVILLPCLKTHFLAKYTGALKISVAFMKPSQRLKLHAGHLQEKIAELNTIIHPDLVIMDARKCFITNGPTHGETREPNIIMASTSRIAIDVEGVNIIKSFDGNKLTDIKSEDLVQIKYARELGVT